MLIKNKDLNAYFSELKAQREQQLEADLEKRKSELADTYDIYYEQQIEKCEKRVKVATDAAEQVEAECQARTTELTTNLQFM